VPDGRVNGPAGLDRAQLASLTRGGPGDACWTDPAEAALIAAADQLHDGADIDDPGWAALAAGRTPAQVVDVLLLAGWYHAVSYAATAARVDREPWAAGFADYT
jgi:hypothetical protein